MCKVSKILQFIIFADDTNIFCLNDNPIDMIRIVNEELEKLTMWFKVNKLSLNVSKSNYMVFSKKAYNIPDVKLDGIMLEKVMFTKFLGVLIDYQLNWNCHIQSVQAKVAKSIGAMYRIKHKVDSKILLMIYNTLILPHLSYCCEIWGNTYNTRLNNLILLQKRAIRIVDNAGWREHSSEIFRKYRILKLTDLIEYQTCIHMYRANLGILPENVQKNFSKVTDVHKHNTRNKTNFFICHVSSTLRKMSVNTKGITLWNGLSENVKSSVSLNVFKNRLKKEMLYKY